MKPRRVFGKLLTVLLLLPLAACAQLDSNTYYAVHAVIPDAVGTEIANALPYQEDVWAPGTFWLPPPSLPPTGLHDGDTCSGMGVASELNTLVLKQDAGLRGTIAGVEPKCVGCKWQHDTWYVKPDDPHQMNAWNAHYADSWPHMGNTIKVRAPLGKIKELPKVGERVETECDFGLDWNWGGTTCCAAAWRPVK